MDCDKNPSVECEEKVTKNSYTFFITLHLFSEWPLVILVFHKVRSSDLKLLWTLYLIKIENKSSILENTKVAKEHYIAMPYVKEDGTIVEKAPFSVFGWFWGILNFFYLLGRSLVEPAVGGASRTRGGGGAGGGGGGGANVRSLRGPGAEGPPPPPAGGCGCGG